MKRPQIKVYVTDEWLSAIRTAAGETSVSDFVRDAIIAKLPESLRKELPTLKQGVKR